MTRAFARLLAVLAIGLASPPALAAEAADDMAGFWGLGPTPDDLTCEIEFLAVIAYEFEGVWHVARPLHYEDNRATCRELGVEDIVAWSMPEAGDRIWLLAEGEAGFMEFLPGTDRRWTIEKSGHAELPDLVIEKRPGPPVD